MKKNSKDTKGKQLKNDEYGIPRVLEAIRYEKVTEVIPVKVQLSLKLALKRFAGKQGVSTWVRETIIMRLRKEGIL